MARVVHAGAEQAHQKQLDLASVMLRAGIWLTTNNISGRIFPQVVALLKYFQVLPADTPQYNHARYYWATLFAASEALLRQVAQELRESPTFGLYMDGSPDRMCSEDHTIVYVRYLVPHDKGFTVKESFLALLPVVQKNGAVMFKQLCELFKAIDVPLSKACAIVTDGGSEYTGKHEGLIAHLRRNNTTLLHNHCGPHKAQLAMGDQLKDKELDCSGVTLASEDKLLSQVHNFFSKSTKRKAAWRKLLDIRSLKLPRSFPTFCVTRWFSRRKCIDALALAYPVLLVFCRAMCKVWSQAADLAGNLEDANTAAITMGLRDIVIALDIFSQSLQVS